MLAGSILLKHCSLSQKMGFKLDHFLEMMEMKSLKKNLALKITILLLHDPILMIFKEGVQSLEGMQDYFE